MRTSALNKYIHGSNVVVASADLEPVDGVLVADDLRPCWDDIFLPMARRRCCWDAVQAQWSSEVRFTALAMFLLSPSLSLSL